jgi:dCTP diphosphatase
MDIKEIQSRLADFARARDWDQFHSPKNLSMALAGEAGELLEIFRWLTEEESVKISTSEKDISAAREEIADIFIFLARLADKLGIDIEKAVIEKMAVNEEKYPVEKCKGKHTKYDRL